MGRLSRAKTQVKGSLKGMSFKEYCTLQKFTDANIVSETRRFLPHNLFTKLDRQRPMTRRQALQVVEAVNMVLFEKCKAQYPIATPIAEFDYLPVRGIRNKRIVRIRRYTLLTLKPFPLSSGTSYSITKDPMSYRGREGVVVFSTHAINRFMERNPEVMEMARKETLFVPSIFSEAIQEQIVEESQYGPQLKVGKLGYFTLVTDEYRGTPLWVCTTYLAAGMRGAADTISISKLVADLRSRFGGFSNEHRQK